VECGVVVVVETGGGEVPRALVINGSNAQPRFVTDAEHEWEVHIQRVTNQPAEVIQNAWTIFQQVYTTQGAVTGNKARALVLVSLLYSNRLLHGTDRVNEEYLLKNLSIPNRTMNKAFTQMAAVTLPLPN
jgi:hypothetical protein